MDWPVAIFFSFHSPACTRQLGEAIRPKTLGLEIVLLHLLVDGCNRADFTTAAGIVL